MRLQSIRCMVLGLSSIALATAPLAAQDPSFQTRGNLAQTLLQGTGVQVLDAEGRKVPADRIRRGPGNLTILDENGSKLYELRFQPGAGQNPIFLPHTTQAWTWPQPRKAIGIMTSSVDEALAHQLRLGSGSPVMITEVRKGSPAERAGLQRFDVLIAVDGTKLESDRTLADALQQKEEGELATIDLIRNGNRMSLSVEVEESQGYSAFPGDPFHTPFTYLPGTTTTSPSVTNFGGLYGSFQPADGQGMVWRPGTQAPFVFGAPGAPDEQAEEDAGADARQNVSPMHPRYLEFFSGKDAAKKALTWPGTMQQSLLEGNVEKRLASIEERLARLDSLVSELVKRLSR